jgi:hypothetical protein
MSTPFRKKIDAAKQAYESLSYPGDLAAEMLTSAPLARSRWIIAALATAAVAAMVTVLILVHPGDGKSPNTAPNPIAQVTEPAPPAVAESAELPPITLADLPGVELPQPDEQMDMAPQAPVLGFGAAPDFSFSAPSFSLIPSDNESQQEQSTPTGAVYAPTDHT